MPSGHAGATIRFTRRRAYDWRIALNPIQQGITEFATVNTLRTECQVSRVDPVYAVSASPDPNGAAGREKLGIVPESQGGSDWVKTEKQSNGWYCVGFVITGEMLKAPVSVAR